jgi:aspartate/methionine/tyrosine aminotransferase
MPADTNAHGTIFGGWVMAQVDLAGSVLPARILRGGLGSVITPLPRFENAEAAWDYVERGLQAGVAVAPGAAFGEAYAHYVRICFTCVDEPTLEKACAILAGL